MQNCLDQEMRTFIKDEIVDTYLNVVELYRTGMERLPKKEDLVELVTKTADCSDTDAQRIFYNLTTDDNYISRLTKAGFKVSPGLIEPGTELKNTRKHNQFLAESYQQ